MFSKLYPNTLCKIVTISALVWLLEFVVVPNIAPAYHLETMAFFGLLLLVVVLFLQTAFRDKTLEVRVDSISIVLITLLCITGYSAIASPETLHAWFGVYSEVGTMIALCLFVTLVLVIANGKEIPGITSWKQVIIFLLVICVIGGLHITTFAPAQVTDNIPNMLARTVALQKAVYDPDSPTYWFGSGPNLFERTWHQKRWYSISHEPYQELVPTHLYGVASTYSIQSGALGLLGWLALLGTVLFAGIKNFFVSRATAPSRFVVLGISGLVVTLLVTGYSYTTLLVCAFSIAYLLQKTSDNSRKIVFSTQHPLCRAFVLVGSFFILMVTVIIFRQTVANIYYQQGLTYMEASDYVIAEQSYKTAVEWYRHSFYYRAIVEIQQAALLQLQTNKDTFDQARFHVLAQEAILLSREAIRLGVTDHKNWFLLGSVYYQLDTAGVANALDNSRLYFIEALRRSPYSYKNNLALALVYAQGYEEGDEKRASDMAKATLLVNPNSEQRGWLLDLFRDE